MKQTLTHRLFAAAFALLLHAMVSAAADDRATVAHGMDGRTEDVPAASIPPQGPD